jgi:hypothetical protein
MRGAQRFVRSATRWPSLIVAGCLSGCTPIYTAVYTTDCNLNEAQLASRTYPIAKRIADKWGSQPETDLGQPGNFTIGSTHVTEYQGRLYVVVESRNSQDEHAQRSRAIVEDVLSNNGCPAWKVKEASGTINPWVK